MSNARRGSSPARPSHLDRLPSVSGHSEPGEKNHESRAAEKVDVCVVVLTDTWLYVQYLGADPGAPLGLHATEGLAIHHNQ